MRKKTTSGFPNAEQAAIISHRRGSLLVLAPAGTGKTRVMSERLALALDDGINLAWTLGISFTNRAVDEMRDRVEKRLG